MRSDGLILVTGGTGNLGRRVVPRLVNAGRQVRVLSRRPYASTAAIEYVTGNLTTSQGIERATEGAETVVHCAATGKINEDATQTRHLVSAAKAAGVEHIVNISVVGADRIPVKSAIDRAMFAYFASQLGKERIIIESGLPWTNLRATQFHDGFILVMVDALSKLPVIFLPSFRFQPVETNEVADMLAEFALGQPQGQAPDIAGPKIYAAGELLRSYLNAIGKRRPIIRMSPPGAAAAALRAGANLAPDRAVGKRTWEEFLGAWSMSPDRSVRPAFSG